ncbi:hypothetical protein GCM10009655_12720 [Rhodoglobus aureus]|uniref:Uncharacterized protein n=2 Tax=Rhodoglobus aureus TaxID=191497 RepID=A0ABN1VLC6_9MICO
MEGRFVVSKLLLMPRVWRLSRTGTIEPNATTTNQRAATFAASAPDGSVLLTRRDDDGLSHWLIAPDATGVEQSALHLAQTVAARAEELVEDVPELFDSKHIAVVSRKLRSPKGKTGTKKSQYSASRRAISDSAIVVLYWSTNSSAGES